MRWPVSYTRNSLIAGALFIAAAMAFHLVRSEPPTLIGCSIPSDNPSYRSWTWVKLTFKEFHPAGNQFIGSVVIEVAPRPDRMKPGEMQKWAADFKQVVLRFDHYDVNTLSYQGGGDGPIALAFPPAWGSLMGKGTFSWAGIPQPGPFFYPFDRYVLRVNPSLLQLSDSGNYPTEPIDTLQTDFGSSNFIPHLHDLQAKYPNDVYEITLERPALLRVLAIIVAILLVVWLIYLILSAKPEEYAGQVVTLFVGVFSIRSSLLSGAPVFPSLIDYCALGVYLSAVLIVLIKWRFPDKKSKECPYCKSSIPLAATICPQCTHALELRT